MDYFAAARPLPPCLFISSQCGSHITATEPTGLRPWQRRWNREWLHEAYIPQMRHNHLVRQLQSNRDAKDYYLCQKALMGTEKFMSTIRDAGVIGPGTTLEPDVNGIMCFTWPVRMLASHAGRLWRRWRKHREKAKKWQMVVVMEEHGDTPRWKGEMRLTIEDDSLKDYLKTTNREDWIVFPSPEDIKWYSVRAPGGLEWLQGGQVAGSWAADPAPTSRIPFVVAGGRVTRNRSPHDVDIHADGDVSENFVAPCSHCGQRS
ncbi:hypothetical protein F4802DRAFT_592966 [Xylaria palmicola]|nr:hypothetical protein F4802DRAFT_592966 [Xylaria palmicola]